MFAPVSAAAPTALAPNAIPKSLDRPSLTTAAAAADNKPNVGNPHSALVHIKQELVAASQTDKTTGIVLPGPPGGSLAGGSISDMDTRTSRDPDARKEPEATDRASKLGGEGKPGEGGRRVRGGGGDDKSAARGSREGERSGRDGAERGKERDTDKDRGRGDKHVAADSRAGQRDSGGRTSKRSR